jgi:microcystin-dependent protein
MALATFQISDDLNIDGAVVNLTGASTGQALVYSASGTVFNPTTINPVGTVVMYCGSTAPSGWLICDGTVYNISSYPTLGALLGSKYGGNGTTTFGVPNFNGRVPVAMNAATTTPPTTLASATNTYNHSHTATYGTDGIGVGLAHTHNSAGASGHFHNTTADKGNHSHGGTTGNAGAAHTHNLGYKMGNVQQATGTGDNAGHQHGFANALSNHSHNAANQSTNHTHTSSANTSLSHFHTHNSVTLNTNAQATSISSHGHSTINAMRVLFMIKT